MNVFSKIRQIVSGMGQTVITIIITGLIATVIGGMTYLSLKGNGFVSNMYDSEYDAYRGTTVYGDSVIRAIESAEVPTNKTRILITVVNDSDTSTYGFDDQGDSSYTGYDNTLTAADDDWISSSNVYSSEVTESNGKVVAITFTEQ